MSVNSKYDTQLWLAESDLDNLEIVPLGSADDADDDYIVPSDLSILPVRNTVLFPGMVIPVTVGRQKSIKLVKKAYKGNRIIGVVAQSNQQKDEPTADDLYRLGTVAYIIKMITLPDGNITIIIQGKKRFEIVNFLQEEPYLTANVRQIDDHFPGPNRKESKALIQSLKESAYKILRLNPEI
ncbi:MAG: endopeptidase La, partial [Sphingobacteriales bacterium]